MQPNPSTPALPPSPILDGAGFFGLFAIVCSLRQPRLSHPKRLKLFSVERQLAPRRMACTSLGIVKAIGIFRLKRCGEGWRSFFALTTPTKARSGQLDLNLRFFSMALH